MAAQICGWITGSDVKPTEQPKDIEQFAQFAANHGVHRCLYDRVKSQDQLRSFSDRLRSQVMREAALESLREREVLRVLTESDLIRGCAPVFFKGQALAYSLYPSMWMRPRVDIDILVQAKDRQTLTTLFKDLGYDQAVSIDSDAVLPQTTFYRELRELKAVWDVHWKISNRPAYAQRLGYETLMTNSETIDLGGVAIRIPNLSYNLLIACVHLVGHHAEELRLIWLYDIYLLIRAIDESQRHDFGSILREEPQLRSACAHAIGLTRRFLPDPALDRLFGEMPELNRNEERKYRRYYNRLSDDFNALSNWSDRGRFLRQHFFPSQQYMVQKYGVQRRWTLPFFYARRIFSALPKLWKRR